MKSVTLLGLLSITTVLLACSTGEENAGVGGTTGATGGGGSQATECSTHSECTPEACSDSEAGTTSCIDGKCKTSCQTGYGECSECMEKTDCTFANEMCSPPKVETNKFCFDGTCSEFCNSASGDSCATEADCPAVQCPGAAAATAKCVSGGCITAVERCCTP